MLLLISDYFRWLAYGYGEFAFCRHGREPSHQSCHSFSGCFVWRLMILRDGHDVLASRSIFTRPYPRLHQINPYGALKASFASPLSYPGFFPRHPLHRHGVPLTWTASQYYVDVNKVDLALSASALRACGLRMQAVGGVRQRSDEQSTFARTHRRTAHILGTHAFMPSVAATSGARKYGIGAASSLNPAALDATRRSLTRVRQFPRPSTSCAVKSSGPSCSSLRRPEQP